MAIIKEKKREIKGIHHNVIRIVREDFDMVLLRGQAVLNFFFCIAVKSFCIVKLVQRSLKMYLYNLWEKRRQNTMSKKPNTKRILDALERFGPSARVYGAHSLRLHYTMGVEFMAEECRAWNLIMAIKPIFKMLATSEHPVAIKIQSNRGNRTKITYYDGEPGRCVPGKEYIEMAFPLKEVVLFYAGGVLMLANEYHRIP